MAAPRVLLAGLALAAFVFCTNADSDAAITPSPMPIEVAYVPALADFVRGLGDLYVGAGAVERNRLLDNFEGTKMVFQIDVAAGTYSGSATSFANFSRIHWSDWRTVAAERIRLIDQRSRLSDPPDWIAPFVAPRSESESDIVCRLVGAAVEREVPVFLRDSVVPNQEQCRVLFAEFIAFDESDPAGYLGWMGRKIGVLD